MKLNRLTERIWIYPYEEERDRPNLCYIKGDRWSLAVDAGHSKGHTEEFYAALKDAALPLPKLTVLTHWHWDHTFGMNAVSGLTLASRRTLNELERLLEEHADDLQVHIEGLDPYTKAEYEDGQPMIVTLPDMVYENHMSVDAGHMPIEITEAVSPHTDDATLIYVPKEKCLFLGDAVLGHFPSGEVDPAKMDQLIETVDALDFTYALTGHWEIRTKEEVLDDMRAGVFD